MSGHDEREAEDDAEPLLGLLSDIRNGGGHGLDRACAQIAWGAGGGADLEEAGR